MMTIKLKCENEKCGVLFPLRGNMATLPNYRTHCPYCGQEHFGALVDVEPEEAVEAV